MHFDGRIHDCTGQTIQSFAGLLATAHEALSVPGITSFAFLLLDALAASDCIGESTRSKRNLLAFLALICGLGGF